MGILLALAAAAAYGLSDFVGGLASRRTSAWPVAFVASVTALLGGVVVATIDGGDPSGHALLWGCLAGVGTGFGTTMLYRGLAAGRMAVVGPVSAVAAAVLPVAVGVATGERPSVLVWLGILLALPGIALAASAEEQDEHAHPHDIGAVRDGLLAGAGFGLSFVGLGHVTSSAGLWPFALAQGVSVLLIASLATVLRERWRPSRAADAWGMAAGLLACGAQLGFLLAARSTLLSVSSVLTSLYPAVTVLLAVAVLHERISPRQAIGLALCAGTVALVAAG
ncbi:MAG TPA: DMT family transporter [Nocardioides sp.]|nr:DMT family transporter [Nocardioides sp.]